MNNKHIRIKDIARMAGVSVGTVDRVIHNRGKVSEEAMEKIMAVLDKTGYKPNLLARTLGSNKNYLIAALVPEPSQDEYWAHTNEGIIEARDEWAQYNIDVMTFYYDLYNKTSFQKTTERLINSNPDAIISSPVFHNESLTFFQQYKDSKVPYVFFNSTIPEVDSMCFIGQDYYQSGRLGAELLDIKTQSPGIFAILHIYEDIHNSVHLAQKEKGFIDYFVEKQDNNYKAIGVDYSNPEEPTLKKELSELLSNPEVKGLLVTTSKGVHMAASYLESHERADISLVGYDLLKENISYLNKGVIDFLIHQSPRKQTALGISHLANHLLFEKKPPVTDLFPLEVITRQNLITYLGQSIQHI